MKTSQILLLLLSLFPFYSFGQSTEELIAKHHQAIGGEQKWMNINSYIIEKSTDDELAIITSKEYFVRHKFYRKDISYGGRSSSDKTKKYFLFATKTKGWKLLLDNKNGNIETMNNKEIDLYIHQCELDDPFVNYKQAGTSILFMNREYFNEKDYYKFLIKTATGSQEYCYLDPDTYLISLRVSLSGESESSREYTTYKKNTEGMQMPAEIRSESGISTFQKITINPVIKDDIFQLSSVKK